MKTYTHSTRLFVGLAVTAALSVATLSAQSGGSTQSNTQRTPAPSGTKPGTKPVPPPPPAPVPLPTGYVIGVEDVLGIAVWGEKDLSTDVVVLPDGKITFPVINEIAAVGLTPPELGAKIAAALAAKQIMQDPTVYVIVKQINSRKVFVTGNVAKPGPYPLVGPMNIVQLITVAGGLLEFAKKDQILVIRANELKPNGDRVSLLINFEDISKGKNLAKNLVELRPGDQIIVR